MGCLREGLSDVQNITQRTLCGNKTATSQTLYKPEDLGQMGLANGQIVRMLDFFQVFWVYVFVVCMSSVVVFPFIVLIRSSSVFISLLISLFLANLVYSFCFSVYSLFILDSPVPSLFLFVSLPPALPSQLHPVRN